MYLHFYISSWVELFYFLTGLFFARCRLFEFCSSIARKPYYPSFLDRHMSCGAPLKRLVDLLEHWLSNWFSNDLATAAKYALVSFTLWQWSEEICLTDNGVK